MKGTRSAQMYVGLLLIVLVGLFARAFDLIAVKWILDSVKTIWLIAFVILFQPELRHVLAQFGRTRYFRSFLRGDSYGVLGEVVRAAETLGKRRQGALLVIERNTGPEELRRDRHAARRQGHRRAAGDAVLARLAAARRRGHPARGRGGGGRLHPAALGEPAASPPSWARATAPRSGSRRNPTPRSWW